ncbi:hypothetical protein [Mycobacterium sp. D16R24]|uniref:hypothetical protein n=1 Tax=Mycobacterium sp. D16R24 TaxID=1855656 RepID=UPI0009935AA5|nr:hypothetical protein [Mycobacterium sp. D16R24]
MDVDALGAFKGEVANPATVNTVIGGYDTHGVLYIPRSEPHAGRAVIPLSSARCAQTDPSRQDCVPVR